ncbi:MAG: hypothetical protein AB1643_01735 [Patescibacteria group bacterium]
MEDLQNIFLKTRYEDDYLNNEDLGEDKERGAEEPDEELGEEEFLEDDSDDYEDYESEGLEKE